MAYEFISSLISEGGGVTLFVKKTNAAARSLYSGLGFKYRGDYRITYY
jgi:predicted GNAT family acetyltransferase